MTTDWDMSDPVSERAASGFPSAQPLDALRKDHEYVRKLFGHFLNTDDAAVRQQAGARILEALEMHSRLEESVFYPQVRQLNPQLIDEFVEDHGEVDQMVAQLKGMDASDSQAEPIFRRLCEAVLHHVDEEENRLFPQVESASLDLEQIGLQMQAFEANLVSTQARESAAPRAR